MDPMGMEPNSIDDLVDVFPFELGAFFFKDSMSILRGVNLYDLNPLMCPKFLWIVDVDGQTPTLSETFPKPAGLQVAIESPTSSIEGNSHAHSIQPFGSHIL